MIINSDTIGCAKYNCRKKSARLSIHWHKLLIDVIKFDINMDKRDIVRVKMAINQTNRTNVKCLSRPKY